MTLPNFFKVIFYSKKTDGFHPFPRVHLKLHIPNPTPRGTKRK